MRLPLHLLEAGAAGALMKTAEDKELVDTIRRIAAGETVVSAEIKRLIRSDPPLPQLSERQAEILSAMSKGLTSKEIARQLGLQKDSVDKHVNALLAKTGATNRTQAVAIAVRKQLMKF